uniref:Fibronectin type-III domain-containing protein n=1 Tax=Leptobrachium leishanense TaxID=445787 RepID=A0A8C5QMR5_9ANUR
MNRRTQLWYLSSLLFHLPFCIDSIGSTAIPREENGTKTWDDTTHAKNNNLRPNTTIVPSWTNNESSVSLVPEDTGSQGNTQDGILYITSGDDYYEDDMEETLATLSFPVNPCPYDPCKHMEPPCKEIQMRKDSNCLCPGLMGSTIRPVAPQLGQIVTGDTKVDVSWCSPLSTVHGYRVLYGTPGAILERGPVLNDSYRFYSIGALLPDTSYRVCVVAFNKAGESPTDAVEDSWVEESNTSGPCSVIRTTSFRKLYIYIGLGLIVLAGFLILSVIVCFLCRKRKGNKMNEWDQIDYPY